MRVDPALARLRAQGPDQPLTEAALATWRAQSEVGAITAELARHAGGAGLEQCPVLARLFADAQAGQALLASLLQPLFAALRAEPLALPALGHRSAEGLVRLELAAHAGAVLGLVVHAPRASAAPEAVLFEDGEVHEVVLAGEGAAICYQRAPASLMSAEIALNPGVRLARRGVGEARRIVAVTRPLVLLQLIRVPDTPAEGALVACADGRVLRRVSGCKRTSQKLMALGVLGALGHRPALLHMARLVRDQAAARDLRWEALRQALALDAAEGLKLLGALAGDPADPLAAEARGLTARLCAGRPEMAALLTEAA
ncbi:MAG: hypothetical protein KatS3mg120_0435 [Erythrobacter sp.]|nr:MAG: hypothetical protein KatS3mg120_0435 [Erythrobacter sp.]